LSTVSLPPHYYEQRRRIRDRRNWKKITAWIFGGIVILLVLVFIVLAALLHTQSFRLYVLRIAHQRILDAVGVNLRLRDFSLHLSGLNPTVDLYDVVVESAPPYNSQPLLRMDHLSVGVTIISLLHRKWYLNDVTLNHPLARVFIGQDGVNNLPQPKNSGSPNKTNIFDLGVRHVHLDSGEIYFNDRKSLIDADVQNLQFQSGYDARPKTYSADLSYRNGHVRYQNYNPLTHDLDVRFDAAPDSFHFKHVVLTSGSSKVELAGTLKNYANPEVDAAYHATFDVSELRQLLKNDTLPSGVVRLAGSAQYAKTADEAPLDALKIAGNINSKGLTVRTSTIHTELSDISGRYSLSNGDAYVRDLTATVLGGKLNAFLKIHDLSGAQSSQLHAALQNIGLKALQSLANPQSMNQLSVSGTANANIDARWTKSLDNLTAKADASVRGDIAPPGNSADRNVPLDGDIHAQYEAASQQITFSKSVIRMAQSLLTLNGTVSNRSALQIQFLCGNLQEVESAAEVFSSSVAAQRLGLGGTAQFDGSVRGSTDNPQINGRLTAANLHVKDSDWRSFATNVELNPSQISLQNGEIYPATRGHLTFSASAGLNRWSFEKTNAIDVKLGALQIDIAQFKTLAGIQTPMSGTLAANISLHGSEENPIGNGTIDITQATVSDEPIQALKIAFQGNGTQIQTTVSARLPAGTVQGTANYFPEAQSYAVHLVANGIRLDQFRTLGARNIQLQGRLNLDAQGNGTISNPAMQLRATVPQLQIQDQQINNLSVAADVANHVAQINLDSQAIDTYVRGHGTVNLTGNYNVDASLDTSPIALEPIIAVYAPTQVGNISGKTELRATVKGSLKDKTLLDAYITIPTFTVSYKNNLQLASAAPIQMDYRQGVLTIQRTSFRGTGTDLQLEGSIPVSGATPVSLLLVGTVDLQLAQLIDPDIASSGQIRLNINSHGVRANPNLQGQIQIVNASFASGSAPVNIQNANGTLNLTTTQLEIQQLTADFGGGRLTARGGVTYKPSIQYNLAIAGTGVRFRIPEGVHEGMDTDLAITGSKDGGLIRGTVRLNEVSFSPDFDFAELAGAGSASTPGTPDSFAQNIRLDIGVQTTSDLNLVSSKLSLQGMANLRVRGTAANPVLLGRANLTGGDLIFRGTRYIMQPSTIDFVNPYSIEPRVNLNIDTTVNQYNIHMLFRGNLDHLRTTYTSDPALPPADIINLLVFGKTTEAAAANPTPGNIGAESMIASSVAGQVSSRLEKAAGVSQLSIDPVLGGNQQDPGARVTIQQRVTGSLFVTFATDVTSTQRDVIKLEYDVTPRVSVSGVRDQNGGFAFDVRIHKTW